jgi:hypothetical protein
MSAFGGKADCYAPRPVFREQLGGDASRNHFGRCANPRAGPAVRRDLVAIVMDGSRFLGIATRLNLVNYFRIVQTR